jgi:trans-aconitate 2-methyltransferase
MNKKDWNPELYLKFDRERIQPSIDLVSQISFDNPSKIIDIGCGPGNSTQILVQRLNVGTDEIKGNYDIVFSNATIQWIPNHS